MFFQTLPPADLHLTRWVCQILVNEEDRCCTRAEDTARDRSAAFGKRSFASMSTPQRSNQNITRESTDDDTASEDRKPAAIDTSASRLALDPLLNESPSFLQTATYSEDDSDVAAVVRSPFISATAVLEEDGIHIPPTGEEFLTFHRPPSLEELNIPIAETLLFKDPPEHTYQEPHEDTPKAASLPAEEMEVLVESPLSEENTIQTAQLKDPPPGSEDTKPASLPTLASPAAPPPPRRTRSRRTACRLATKRKRRCSAASPSVIQPTPEERAAADTPRKREALQNWYGRLNELYEYKQRYGDCNVPQKYVKNSKLGIWINKQRMEKKFMDENLKSSMTQFRVDALNRLGFEWAKRKGDFSWNVKFQELCDYCEEHGHANVPTKYEDNKALGRWVSTQRSQHKLWKAGKKTHMTQERYDKLREIGFKFDMLPYVKPQQQRSSGTSEDDEDDDDEDDDDETSEDEEMVEV